MNKHCGRKISLQPQLGGADLNAVFFGPRILGTNSGDPDDPDQPSSSGVGDNLMAISEKPGQPRKHILCVSTYQMCILMMFNKQERFTYEVLLYRRKSRRSCLSITVGKITVLSFLKELATETEISERDLKRAIMSLAMGKPSQRILCRRAASKESKDIGIGFAISKL